VLIRRAELADAEAIRVIYNTEVTMSTHVFELVPHTLEQQQRWILDRSGAHAAVVAVEDDGTVIGFGSLSPYRPRPAYSTTVEDSVYVRPDKQGRGAGRAILAELVRLATAHGFHTIIGRIADHNEASIGLHHSLDFVEVGTEREVGRKFHRWIDVAVMQRLL
jgi:L-amino acid N-acyltransferase YncA